MSESGKGGRYELRLKSALCLILLKPLLRKWGSLAESVEVRCMVQVHGSNRCKLGDGVIYEQ